MENENISAYEKGLKNDIKRNIMDAIHYYELSITQNEKIKDAYINLMLIHWLVTYGYYYYNYDDFDKAGYNALENKYEEILELGKKEFPDEMEFLFWEKYFNNLFDEKEFSEEECMQLADMDKNSLLPFFYLFLKTEKDQYKAKAKKLMREIIDPQTVKNKYLSSGLAKRLH
jgi:hypothetical protein